MNHVFAEQNQVCSGFAPVNMQTAANPGDWISLKDYGRATIVFVKAIGTAGDDPVITLKQATDVSGTGSKVLPINRVDKKQAATNLLSTGAYTVSTPDAPATNDTFTPANGTWTNSDLAEQAAIILIDVKAEDLDANGNFDCIQASVGDVGTNADLGTMLYILSEPRYSQQPLPSAIVD